MKKNNSLVRKEKGMPVMTEYSKKIKDYIIKNNLSTKIVGKDYVQVEGWQFAGGLLKLFPIITKTEELSNGNEIKWKAEAEIIGEDGSVQGRGIAICSNKETKKKTFEEYAILSMAQTRAIGKAFRNRIGWIIKLAGYEATPAEEITQEQKKANRVEVERIIKAQKDVKGLKEALAKIEGSKKYEKEDKEELKGLILDKITELES